MEPFIGQIMQVGFNFAPRGWALCDGAILPISSYTALFSLLGTTFGGDGRTTFGLPDLRGRTAKGVGNGPGLTPVSWGQKAGAETHTMTVAQMPSHGHTVTPKGASGPPDQDSPESHFSAEGDFYNETGDVNMGAAAVSNTGGNQSFSIRNPYLGIYHCIALTGVFPSRS